MTLNNTENIQDTQAAVHAYKCILQSVLDQRPSGTRQRLAEELGKNRSFISQISNPSYKTPIPYKHLETIFLACHFSAAERATFLDAYHAAHPGRLKSSDKSSSTRTVHMNLPDLGSKVKNREFDRLIKEFSAGIAELLKPTK